MEGGRVGGVGHGVGGGGCRAHIRSQESHTRTHEYRNSVIIGSVRTYSNTLACE